MGLWTWAEITTGIIVSCLPVIPKFLQHFGPKFYQTLFSSFGSKSETEPGSTDVKNKIEVSVHFDQRLDEYNGGNASLETRCGSNSPYAQQRREYIIPDEFLAPSETDPTGERLQAPTQVRATRRKDLETGHYAP
jgi:hypothetical protein